MERITWGHQIASVMDALLRFHQLRENGRGTAGIEAYLSDFREFLLHSQKVSGQFLIYETIKTSYGKSPKAQVFLTLKL